MPTYISNTTFLRKYDYRWVGKNVVDDGSSPSLAVLQSSVSAPGSVLADLISEASELVLGAATVAARYTNDDLVAYGGKLLERIVADLTMGLVLKRRARASADEESLSMPYKEALDYLEQLRRGERIFWAVPNVPEAGLPRTGTMNPVPGIDPPLITQSAFRYFGTTGPRPWGC